MTKQHRHAITITCLLLGMAVSRAVAQDEVDQSWFHYGFEVKANYRDTQEVKFPISFPFPPEFLPPGETRGSLESVNEGEHLEISRISLYLLARFSPLTTAKIKLDAIDKYDRNPTGGDTQFDVDEAWLTIGKHSLPDEIPDARGCYLKVGKFEKFERQNDRNLESYGLLSTFFNRFEDAGLELGFDLSRHLFVKLSQTSGNPLFFRDPHALAGENGTNDRNPAVSPFPNPELKSGFPLFYDAEVEWKDLALGSHSETGIGLGTRIGPESGNFVATLMAYGYQRKLRDKAELTGTFYGGDLDLLEGVSGELGLPPAFDLDSDHKKREVGANLWIYWQDFTLFSQFVDSDIAGLKNSGFETELAWTFSTPWIMAIGGKPFLSAITPAVRYSKLDPEFSGKNFPAGTIVNGEDISGRNIYPAPSVWWAWRKWDAGFNISILPGMILTAEYSDGKFLRAGKWEGDDEFLVTYTWRQLP